LEDHEKIKALETSFDKFEEKRKDNEIYFNGQIYDAYSKIQDIFKSVKKNLIIIDSYADNTLLDIIKRLNIKVIVITKKDNLLTHQDISKYNKQYHNLKVIFNNNFHDRYFLIDNQDVYHCGASINRIGYKTFSITMIGDKEVSNLLFNKVNKIILE
ncbi:MAG: ORF6N domain-containing protein, partial [Bacilli bacterium]|nr:ORF6N domain-containing protein [Bacilli bacterium]